MKPQLPAEGILKRNDWGDAITYQVMCQCHDADHDHNVWVEAEETGVNVIVYTTNTTAFWRKSRWQQMWELLTKGYVKQEVALAMTEQQALNYASVLTKAVGDVKVVRDKKLKEK